MGQSKYIDHDADGAQHAAGMSRRSFIGWGAVAALGAEGRSELTGVHHIDRGYQSLEGDLRRLGAEIRRI